MADSPQLERRTSRLDRWKDRARRLKREVHALSFAIRDPRCPWYARLFAGFVIAYAFSPIDLIPDFIPVLGYLDDLILVPLGIVVALRLIPAAVMADGRAAADRAMAGSKPNSRAAAAIIVAIWLLLALLALRIVIRFARGA